MADRGETFDFVFLDTFEGNYPDLFQTCLRLVRPLRIILIDNVLMQTVRGWTTAENVVERSYDVFAALRLTLKMATATEGVTACVIPSGSGLLLAVKN